MRQGLVESDLAAVVSQLADRLARLEAKQEQLRSAVSDLRCDAIVKGVACQCDRIELRGFQQRLASRVEAVERCLFGEPGIG
jgi:hypothetical protein